MKTGLNAKIAIISGGSKGLGLATAIELAHDGAKVMINSRSQANVDAAVQKVRELTGNQDVHGFAADITQTTATNHLVEHTIKTFGGIDIVITNTHGPKAGLFKDIDMVEMQNSFDLIVMSTVNLIRTSLPYLRKSKAASILTVTSVSSKQPIASLVLSNIFRPAVLGLTKSLSQELGPENIRVNSILPGWTATERTKQLISQWAAEQNTNSENIMSNICRDIPLQRFAKPEEFGKVAAFLVSPAASYLTGVMLQVDGGAYKGLL